MTLWTLQRVMPARAIGMPASVLLAILLVPKAMTAATVADEAVAQQPRQAASKYDHFLYLRHNVVDGAADREDVSLVLAKVTPEGFQQRDVLTHSNLSWSWAPLCVVDGRFYARHRGFLLEIDLTTGKATRLTATLRSYTCDSGRVYGIIAKGAEGVLREFDPKTRTFRDLCTLPGASQGPLLAISPNGKTLACYPNGRVLALVDLATGETRTAGSTVFAARTTPRGMFATHGPLFIWLDEKTILLMHAVQEMPAPNYPVTTYLATVDIDSGQLSEVTPLPKLDRTSSSRLESYWQAISMAYLRPLGADSVPRILLGHLGQYRIDVKAKRIIEDDTIVGPYALTRGSSPVRLLCGRSELCRDESILDLVVSPDAQQAVWVTVTGETEGELRYHNRLAGSSRHVAKGLFPAPPIEQPLPTETLILWATGEEVSPAMPSEPPAGREPFPTDSWPPPPSPPRPPAPTIGDFFSLAVSTDKETYEQHEPARVTFTLTNTTDQQVEFNRFTGSSTPFRVTRTSPLHSSIVDVTADMLPIQPEESGGSQSSEGGGRIELFLDAMPLSLGPHESIRLARFLELSDLGENTIVGSVSLDCREIAPYTNRWHGPVESAPLTLKVVPAAEEQSLLEAKVERLFTLCHREYTRNSNWGDYTRLYELGPSAVPLIVDALKACDEVKFRRRMGKGLAAMATGDALPYFEQLLAGDMKDDREMVLDGLATMVQESRSPEEALGLLLEAMEHPELGIRGQAAKRLRRVYDPRVVTAMREQLHREGGAAKTAAMYLAAAEWLDLADWLALAAAKPTEERVRAIAPVVEKLRARWRMALPVPPRDNWGDQLLADADLTAEYRTALGAWEQWARENPRTSAGFFDDERSGWPERPPPLDSGQGREDYGDDGA